MPGGESDQATDQNGVPVPAGVDGADLVEQDDCPACGEKAQYLVEKAGYYECVHCLSVWAGDRENADIVIYMNPESSPDKRLLTDGGESATTTEQEMYCPECGAGVVEANESDQFANELELDCGCSVNQTAFVQENTP